MAEVKKVLPEAYQVDFKFFDDWIQKFNVRHGSRSVKLHGEHGCAYVSSSQEALPKLRS